MNRLIATAALILLLVIAACQGTYTLDSQGQDNLTVQASAIAEDVVTIVECLQPIWERSDGAH